jgi:hypothetical protein
MSKITEVVSPTRGIVGYLHEVECNEPRSILIFQLPRETKFLSDTYVKGAMDSVRKSLPDGRTALVIGCDVNVYELAEADSIILKLKGLI